MNKRTKMYLAVAVLTIALLSFTGVLSANTETLQAVKAKVNFNVNGSNVTLSEQPVIIDGKTYLPVRAMGDVLEKRIGWDHNSKTVTIADRLKDGVYKAAAPDFDEFGWQAQVEVTVKNGNIVDVKYNEVNNEGTLKTNDQTYLQEYKDTTTIDLVESFKTLQNSLINTQNAELVDAVSGATYSSMSFKALVQQALAAGPVAQ